MKKCPQCDLNYIPDDQKLCAVCEEKAIGFTTSVVGRKRVRMPVKKKEGNIAFKCSFCDGGSNSQRIGYAGVCSKENINLNVCANKRSWCSHEDCNCSKYINGFMSYEQLVSAVAPCYESRLLIDYKALAGEDHKVGKRHGNHRRLTKNVYAGLCVLTTTNKEIDPERNRIIFAVFLVDRFREGDEDKESGYVQCTTDYKVELSKDEAEKLLFWNYYNNKVRTDVARWGSGLFRYIDDTLCAQILRDIVAIKKGSEDEQAAIALFDRFCEMKMIEASEIPQNNGALCRMKPNRPMP